MSGDVAWSIRAPGHRSFVVTIAGCGLLLAAGIAAGLYGHSFPVFSVPFEAASRASMTWCTAEPDVDMAAGERYLAMFTHHYAWVDTGVVLVLGALTVACLAFVLRLRSTSEGAWFRSPERRITFLFLGLGVLVWEYVSTMHSLRVDLDRMMFPWCADSIAIPMFELTMLNLFVAPVLVLSGWAITWLFGGLPAPLGRWDRVRPTRSWLVTLIFGSAALGMIALLIVSIWTSMTSATPAFVIAIYLLASTRAALLSPKQRDAVEDCR